MSQPTITLGTPGTVVTTGTGSTPPPPDTQGDPAALGEAGKKALDTERAARTDAEKQLRQLQAELKKHTDAQLSDQQRLEKERDEANSARDTAAKERDEATRVALRFEIAAEKKIPLSMARRLVGTTRQEIEADADAFLKDLPGGGPKPDRSAGAGDGKPDKGSVAAGADMFRDRRTNSTKKE